MRFEGLRALRCAASRAAPRRTWRSTSPPRRVGGGQRLPADPRRLRLRRRVRRRAQVPRDAALPGRADLHQPHPVATSPSTCSACRARSEHEAAHAPLEGITVVTLEHAIAAPFCTRQLADLGARVIKIERPGGGDFARDYDSACAAWRRISSGPTVRKESLTLDLKHAEAAEILARLLARADVLVQNLAPGAAAAWACRTRRCRPTHPRLIVCDISGYGNDRPPGPVPRQEGLRPADPERSGLPVRHGHARRAGQGRQLDRRHLRRHVRLHATSWRR